MLLVGPQADQLLQRTAEEITEKYLPLHKRSMLPFLFEDCSCFWSSTLCKLHVTYVTVLASPLPANLLAAFPLVQPSCSNIWNRPSHDTVLKYFPGSIRDMKASST